MNELALFKQVILTWTYNILNSEFPDFFNKNEYMTPDGTRVINTANVYWADSLRDRPLDATECYLDIVSDEAVSFGVDGKFYQDTDGLYYYEMNEPHEIIVNFAVSSMKNKKLNLTALQAQNLTYNACSYLRMQLKSGSASDYFCYDNGILTPILVCSQNRNVSEITDTSIFEDTRNRHTNQFSCKFAYMVKTKRQVDLAQNIYNIVNYGVDQEGNPKTNEFYTKEQN